MNKKEKCFARKMKKVLREFKRHKLHSGSKRGPMVHKKSQALAIGLQSARQKCRLKK